MRCPECAADNPDDSQFCSGCGNPLPKDQAPPPMPPELQAELESRAEEEPEEEQPMFATPEDDTGQRAFCDDCQGAFAAEDLRDVDGKKLCGLCVHRMNKKSGGKSAGQAFFDDPPDAGLPPAPDLSPDMAPGLGDGPRPPGAGPSHKPGFSGTSSLSEPVSGTKAVFYIGLVVVMAGMLAVAGFFFIGGGDGGASDTPKPEPEPAPVQQEPLPQKKAEEKVDKKPQPPPKPKRPASDYDPRWFTGLFKGVEKVEGEEVMVLVFESKMGEKVRVAAGEELWTLFERENAYKFKYRPTDEFYDKGFVRFDELEVTIQKAP